MGVEELVEAVRGAAGDRAWGAAVRLARAGAVDGLSNDGEEVRLRVKTPQRAVPFDVYLWPGEVDWGCDCGLPGDACVHVCAAAIALQQTKKAGAALPEPSTHYQVRVRYDFTRVGNALAVRRTLVRPDGDEESLEGTLAGSSVVARPADAHAESLLMMQSEGPLGGESLRRLLVLVGANTDATLDGRPVQVDPEAVLFQVRVTDENGGFKVGMYRPDGIDELFRGAARLGDTLRPTSHGDLTGEQRRALITGTHYGEDRVRSLVSEVIPMLRARLPVTIATDRLPAAHALEPRVALRVKETFEGLEVLPQLVYGDPPIARIEKGAMQALGDVVPARDPGQERVVSRAFEQRMGLHVGIRQVLPPERAATFLQERLPMHRGPVEGRVDSDRFRVVEGEVRPHIDVSPMAHGDREEWRLDVSFRGEQGEADVRAVLEAWRSGRSLVPLLDGGYAPLPKNWLQEHGALLRELLEARDAEGRVDRNATAALVELLEDTEAQVPHDLQKLQRFLEAGEGLPEVPLPEGFVGEMRPYQIVGYRWLHFLRQVDLNGVLADDMGLGKTIQALAAMSDAGGQSLVVAPTSVLRNWEREAARFTPNLSVNLYHGAGRQLDDSAITLTSYALLRMDLSILRQRQWTYAILDEAQSIKNPQSQTARSAFALKARHRLALTGTPIENRLEELWSLFRYLNPGLLGSRESFRDRFARPVEAGDETARGHLRNRVKPYVLRRLKSQVAKELPPLTEVVVRCEMTAEQRKVYDAVRLAAREDVQRALQERGMGGSTMAVLEALLRMRQAACDPSLLPGDIGEGAGSAKLDRLEELLVELIVEDHKALIFSQWTSMLDRVEPRLEALGIPWVRLDGSTRNRQEVIDQFQSPDGPPVFLLSLKAGGTGLNLTAADYVVLMDPWWNPAVEQQATDRAHRIGQDKPVVSCRLVAEDTVEERILELQDAKRDLADAALGTEGGFLRALTADELRSLFEAA